MKARIPTLQTVLDPHELAKHLHRVLPAQWGILQNIKLRVLQHHPGSRCTVDLRLQTTTGNYELVGKVYAEDRSDVYRAMKQISESSFGPEEEFSIPQAFAFIPELHLLLQEKVQGPLVTEIFLEGSDRERAVAAERCARWLAHFHARAALSGPGFVIGRELLESWVRRLLKRAGKQAGKLMGRAALLCDWLENASVKLAHAEMCACHGTYCHYQIILTETRTVTVDWDGVCIANPGLDLARFIVVLRQLALESRGSLNALDAAVEVFYKTYTAQSNFDVAEYLPFYKAAYCLNHARQQLKPRNVGVEMAEKMLDEGLRILAEEMRNGNRFIPVYLPTIKPHKIHDSYGPASESAHSFADPSIPALQAVLDPYNLGRYLYPVLPPHWGTLQDMSVQVLQQHRGKRCTVDITLQTTTGSYGLIGKVYAKDRSDVYRVMKQISQSGFGPKEEYSIPQPLTYVPAIRLLLQEKVQGPLAKEIFLQGNEQSAMAAERCGRWLAQFHATDDQAGRTFNRNDQLVSLERWTQRMAASGHPLADKANQLLKRLKVVASALNGAEARPGHGDYWHHQIILTEGRTVTFDWDSYRVADPSRDLARFIITLKELALRSHFSLKALDAAVEVFYKTYTTRSQFEVGKSLAFYKAAHCLMFKHKLKPGPGGIETADIMLDEGFRILADEV